MQRIGIIGVGLLGSAVASRLLERGFCVTGYDTRPGQIEALRPKGLRAAASVAEASAGAEAVFTILPSLESVEATVRGTGGLLETAPCHAILVQMSTISPDLARRLGDAATGKGFRLLDAPISGTSVMVARGDCTILVGGDPACVEECRPVFDAIAGRTAYVGAVGTASLVKLAINLLVGLNTAALAEALVLGKKGGISPASLLELLRESAGASKMAEVRGPLMVAERFDPQITLDLFLKDFRLMLDAGRRLGVPLPLTSIACQLATATSAAGRADQDLAAIVTTFERLAGIFPPTSPSSS